jgi:hypothetical protein
MDEESRKREFKHLWRCISVEKKAMLFQPVTINWRHWESCYRAMCEWSPKLQTDIVALMRVWVMNYQ